MATKTRGVVRCLVCPGLWCSGVCGRLEGDRRVHGDLIQKDVATMANGLPLDVVGKVLLPVKLGNFQQNQEFVVARNSAVPTRSRFLGAPPGNFRL